MLSMLKASRLADLQPPVVRTFMRISHVAVHLDGGCKINVAVQ